MAAETKEETKALKEANRQLRSEVASLKLRLEELPAPARPSVPAEEISRARKAGVIEGIKRFAWSKAGAQFVGHPPGIQLKHVLKDLE